jgi:hypothetical protein
LCKINQIIVVEVVLIKTTRGNQSFVEIYRTRGAANVKFAEDFFASSPTANLVDVTEEGHERFSVRLWRQKCTS